MPKRKISIEEAFAVLNQAGINVQVKPAIEDNVPVQVIKKREPLFPVQVSSKFTKVKLYSKHTIGSGGFLVADVEGKRVDSAGVQTYGPGVCNIPTELAGQLLHQDMLARQADENMLDRTQHSYIVVRKSNADGHSVNVGFEVSGALFDEGIENINSGYMHRL